MLGHNSNALMPWSLKKNDLWNFQRFLTSVIYDTFRCWILEVQWINFLYFIFNFFWIYLSLFLDNDALILDFSQVFCSCNLVKHLECTFLKFSKMWYRFCIFRSIEYHLTCQYISMAGGSLRRMLIILFSRWWFSFFI